MPAPGPLPWSFGGYAPPAESLATLEGTSLAWQSDHPQAAKDLLISRFRKLPRFTALLGAILAGVQELEDVIWQVLVGRWIDTAEGVQLDLLGTILNYPRKGWPDETYRKLLRGAAVALSSDGTWPSMFAVMEAVEVTLAVITVDEPDMAEMRLVVNEPMATGIALGIYNLLRKAHPVGVRILMEYFVDADSEIFTFSDTLSTIQTSATLGYGWSGDATTGGHYAGAFDGGAS